MIEALIWALSLIVIVGVCCGTIVFCVLSDNRRKREKIEADKKVEMERERTKQDQEITRQGLLTLRQEELRIQMENAGLVLPRSSNDPFELR